MSSVITIKTAAELSGIPVRLLNDWARDGTLPGAHRAKDGVYRSRWLITVEEFEAALPELRRRRERFGYRKHTVQRVLPLRPARTFDEVKAAASAMRSDQHHAIDDRHPATGLPTAPMMEVAGIPVYSREQVCRTVDEALAEHESRAVDAPQQRGCPWWLTVAVALTVAVVSAILK